MKKQKAILPTTMFSAYVFVLMAFCSWHHVYAIPPEMRQLLPEEIIELILSLRQICATKYGLTDADIESYVITNSEEKYRCYMTCMMHEAKWMSQDGTIHYEHILDGSHSVVKPILEKIFAKCGDIETGADECSKAYNFHVCLQKADPVHYFLP